MWLAALPPAAESTAARRLEHRSPPLGAPPTARSPLRAPPWRALQWGGQCSVGGVMGGRSKRWRKGNDARRGEDSREDKVVWLAQLPIFHVPWMRGALTRRRTHRALSSDGSQAFSYCVSKFLLSASDFLALLICTVIRLLGLTMTSGFQV
jgi:hypothetical protein